VLGSARTITGEVLNALVPELRQARVEARARLLGLIGPATKRTACQQPQTLVLHDDDCRLRGCPDHT